MCLSVRGYVHVPREARDIGSPWDWSYRLVSLMGLLGIKPGFSGKGVLLTTAGRCLQPRTALMDSGPLTRWTGPLSRAVFLTLCNFLF